MNKTPMKTTSGKSVKLAPAPPSAPGAYLTIGLVIGAAAPATGGSCLVTYPENPSGEAQPALLLSHVPAVLPGQSVLLQFVCADFSRPVVLGVLASSSAVEALPSQEQDQQPCPALVQSQVPDRTLTLQAEQQLVLRCGKASLVMQADGTIELRGTDVMSRASGQNALRGASISLN